jgi:selenocysteine-specific elongation factor
MILATAGHIDHGKTALVRALTGVDPDRLPEEKARGLTIDLGFAYGTLPDGGEIGFVDVPGHERFLPNMLAGVLGIDRVLLVVAADDGPRPQTLEHLDILELIGVAEITGVVTKIDRAGPERSADVRAEVERLLVEAGFAGGPVIAVSSHTGEGLAELSSHLEERARVAARAPTTARPAGLFRMAIDRSFGLPGIGLVVTGTIAAGMVTVGDRLMLGPRGIPVRVRALHAHNRAIASAAAGERCAVNIAGTFPDGAAPRRGNWLIAPERHLPVQRIDLQLRASRHAALHLRDGLPVHLHIGTEDVVGRVAVLSGRSLDPGESGFAQIDLERPIAALSGDRAVLRDHGARTTLAGGRVVDPLAPRRGRRSPERLAMLSAMAAPDPAAALRHMLAVAGVVDLARFSLLRNLGPGEMAALTAPGHGFRRVGPQEAAVAIAPRHLARLADEVAELLGEWHRAQPDLLGPTGTALIARLRAVPPPAIDAALAELAAAGRAVREVGMWRLSGHRPRLSNADEKLWARVQDLLRMGELRPPRVREVAEALALEPSAAETLLRRAERLGRVAKVADNRFFLPETLARLAALARELAAAGPEDGFTAAMFKDHSGIGRNLTIQLLEYFDKVGVTRRVGSGRVILSSAPLLK